jgi:hypothetical protein
MGTANKNRTKARLWKYLMENGPQTYARMIDDLPWLGPVNQVTMLLTRCYLFEQVGKVRVARGGIAGSGSVHMGGNYDVVVWGALPLDIAVKQFLTPRKHQIRPLSKQPLFVREHVEAMMNEDK